MLRARFAIAFAIAVSLAPAVNAGNLLVNPNFDSGINGWTAMSDVSAAWHKSDAWHSPQSGSIAVTYTAPGVNGGGSGVMQCVPVSPETTYNAGVKVMITGGQIAADGLMTGYSYTSSDCSGSSFGGFDTSYVHITSNGGFTPVAQRGWRTAYGVHSVKIAVFIVNHAAGVITANFDDAYFGAAPGCVPDDQYACLDGGRFAVQATFTAPGQAPQNAHLVQLTPDTATMWFFDPNNVEITMKVLNACSVSAYHWVFMSGLTNVDVAITVTDMQTGATKTWRNPQGTYFAPQFDTAAFACP